MNSFGLAIAWNWEFDADFIRGIEQECHRRNISTYLIIPGNVSRVVEELRAEKISFGMFYDRASDADEAFLPLVTSLRQRSIRTINPHDDVAHAMDKTSMHLECITHDVRVPQTIIVPSYNNERTID